MHEFLLNIRNHIKAYKNQPIHPNTAQYLNYLVEIYTNLMDVEDVKVSDLEKFELELTKIQEKELSESK